MKIASALLACAGLLPAFLSPLRGQALATSPAITAADARLRVHVLADDSMMGREAGTRGNVIGTDFLAREAARIGLQPAGENGTFFQTIPLVRRGVSAAATLRAGSRSLVYGTDFVLLPTVPEAFTFADRLRADGTAVVFGGRLGGSDMIEPTRAAGKIVVFAPPLEQGRPGWRFWASTPLSGYASAAAVAIASLDATPPSVRAFLVEPQTVLAQPAAVGAGASAGLLLTASAAEALFGRPLSEVQPGTAGTPLSGAVAFAETPAEHPARNVVAVIPGRDPRLSSEYVAVGAHNDHDGVGRPVDHDSMRAWNRVLRPSGMDQPPDSLTPERQARVQALLRPLRERPARRDSILNGADDDASGSVALLEVAELLVDEPPGRSVLFVWHTAEEKGLLGSEYFTDHPTVPRGSIVAQLNLDMVGRGAAADISGGGPAYLQLVGTRRLSTELGDLVEQVNRESGHAFRFDYGMDADGHPANIYCRSDHYSYARYGIPIAFFTTGLHPDYHMVTDEPQYLDYEKLARVSALVADVVRALGERPERPRVDRPVPPPGAACRQ